MLQLESSGDQDILVQNVPQSGPGRIRQSARIVPGVRRTSAFFLFDATSKSEEGGDIGNEGGEEFLDGTPCVAIYLGELGVAAAPDREADESDDDEEDTDGEQSNKLETPTGCLAMISGSGGMKF